MIFHRAKDSSDFALIYDENADPNSATAKLEECYVMKPGDEIRLQISEKKARFAIDNDLFTNFSFCETMDIEVKFDPQIYEVHHRAIHAKSKDLREEKHFDGKKLVLNAPFLPSNGVMIWWNRLQT